MKLFGFLGLLIFFTQVYNGIAPIGAYFALEVFVGQRFQSEVCEAELSPIWSINNVNLIHKDVLQGFNARVDRNDDDPGRLKATLTISLINLTLDSCQIACYANSTRIMTYTLAVVNTTVVWLAPNDTFQPKVCKSLLRNSSAPFWTINDVILISTSLSTRYNAEINWTFDDYGRHQAELIVRSINATLHGSNISCLVGSELRRVYILYITPPSQEQSTTVSTVDEHVDDESAMAANNAKGTSNGNIVIGVLIPGTCIFVVVCFMLVCIKCKDRIFSKCKTGDVETDIRRLDETVVEEYRTDPTELPCRCVLRGGEDGEEIAVEGHGLDIQPLCDNMSPDQNGVPNDQGVPEINQDEARGVGRVHVHGKDVLFQNGPVKPLKTHFTEDKVLREE